jgi:hypothetical protein
MEAPLAKTVTPPEADMVHEIVGETTTGLLNVPLVIVATLVTVPESVILKIVPSSNVELSMVH